MNQADVISASRNRSLQLFWEELMEPAIEAGRNRFAVEHLPLVQATAARLHARLPRQVELDDLIQVGVLGLFKAMKAYDPKKPAQFSTFAPFYIRGAILDHLRDTDWVPRLVRKRVRIIDDANRQLQQKLGRMPTQKELAEFVQLPTKKFDRVMRDSRAVSQMSLSQSARDSKCDEANPSDQLPADPRTLDPSRSAQRASLKEFILQNFCREERLILILYYYEHLCMREIGDALGISESRVSQVHKGLLKRLKSRFGAMQKEFETQE